MSEIIRFGKPPIDVNLRKSRQARRISLRVSGLDGKVSLTVPRYSNMREAQDFLIQKEEWIRKHLARQPEVGPVQIGTLLPVEGIQRQIVEHDGKRVALHPEAVLVPRGADKAATRLRAFLKTLARDRLADAAQRYSDQLGRSFGRISIRDTRSRWGSCSSEGNLMFSWRLILAPPAALDYVAAHEVAHLAIMDHSPRFWAQVEELMPDYAAPRAWLRREGAGLHRFRFEAT